MYLKKTASILILVAALFAAGCAKKPEIRAYVPENAAFFAEIADAEAFFADADGFVKELGLQALLQNKGLMEFADDQLKALLQGFSLSTLDLTKPVGLAMILPGLGQSRPATILYLPLKDGAEMEKTAAAMGFSKTAKAGSYGILYESEGDLAFPPRKKLDLSGLDRYKSGGLSFFVNVKGILSQYGAGLDIAVASFLDRIQSASPEEDGGSQAMMKIVAAKTVEALRQVDSLDGSVRLTQEGLITRTSLGFAKGTGLAAFMRASGASKNPGPFVKYLPKDHLIAMAADLDPKAQKLAADFLVDFLGELYALAPEERDYYRGMMKTMLAQAGTKAAFGVDVDMDFHRLALLESTADGAEEAAAQAIGAMGIRGVGVYGVKDGPAYLVSMRSIYDDPRFQAVMNKSSAVSGLKVSTRIEDAKEGDLSYQTYTLAFEAVPRAGGGIPLSRGTLDALSDMTRMYMAPAKDRIFVTIGREGLPELSSIVKADANSGDLSKNPNYALFTKLAGSEAQIVCRFSVNRLLSFVSGAAGMATGMRMSFSVPEEANTGIWALYRAQGDSLQGTGFWGAKEIGSVVQQAGAVMAQSLMR
jgi:hypothetical protein